ncbi:MAG: nucleotide sugar dehydrogenase, partial [Planctomycetota bacterium]
MKISVIGLGVVGLVTGLTFARKGHYVIGTDIDAHKIDDLNKGISPFYEPHLEDLLRECLTRGSIKFITDHKESVETSEVIFITVGTPMSPTGEADLSSLEKVAREVAWHMNDYKVIVEKSTVPVKTGEKLEKTIRRYLKKFIPFDVVSNPEFLREGNAVFDSFHPSRIVIGTSSQRARNIMAELYKDFEAPIIYTTLTSAELIKHASNSFLALKI